MDRQMHKKIMEETIDEVLKTSDEEYAKQYKGFLEQRNDEYKKKILRIYSGEEVGDLDEFIEKFYEVTKIPEDMFIDENTTLIDDDDILKQLTTDQKESLEKWLNSKEEYKEISPQEIGTVIRLKDKVIKNEYKREEAINSARRKSEEYGESFSSRVEKELYEWGVKSDIEGILGDVLDEEETLKDINIKENLHRTIETPETINARYSK